MRDQYEIIETFNQLIQLIKEERRMIEVALQGDLCAVYQKLLDHEIDKLGKTEQQWKKLYE